LSDTKCALVSVISGSLLLFLCLVTEKWRCLK